MPRPKGPYVLYRRTVRYDCNGVPIDPADWDVEDWRILHEGMDLIRRMIAAQHRERREAGRSDDDRAD